MVARTLLPVFLAIVAFSGCVTRSPILFFRGEAVQNPRKVPLKVGVDNIQFKFPDEDLTNVSTSIISPPFTFMFYSGCFPKTDEKQFLADSVVQYLQDVDLFSFIYAAPYDPKDVDLVIKVGVAEFDASNSVYGTVLQCFRDLVLPYGFMGLAYAGVITSPELALAPPVIMFILYVGQLLTIIPQEYFLSTMAFHVDLCLPNGDRILSYQNRVESSDFVNMWEQPFGAYLWYDSVFKNDFLKVWDGFRQKIEADNQAIVAAVERYRRGS